MKIDYTVCQHVQVLLDLQAPTMTQIFPFMHRKFFDEVPLSIAHFQGDFATIYHSKTFLRNLLYNPTKLSLE